MVSFLHVIHEILYVYISPLHMSRAPLSDHPEYLVSSSDHDAVVVPIVIHMNLVHVLIFNIHFNIIILFIHRFSKWSFPFRFLTRIL